MCMVTDKKTLDMVLTNSRCYALIGPNPEDLELLIESNLIKECEIDFDMYSLVTDAEVLSMILCQARGYSTDGKLQTECCRIEAFQENLIEDPFLLSEEGSRAFKIWTTPDVEVWMMYPEYETINVFGYPAPSIRTFYIKYGSTTVEEISLNERY